MVRRLQIRQTREHGISDDENAPYANMNTLIVKAISVWLVIPRSDATMEIEGDIMEEDTGEIKVNRETISVARHLAECFQLEETVCQMMETVDVIGEESLLFGILGIVWPIPVNHHLCRLMRVGYCVRR